MRTAPNAAALAAAAAAVLVPAAGCGSGDNAGEPSPTASATHDRGSEGAADLGQAWTAALEVEDDWDEPYPRATGTAEVAADQGTTITLAVSGLAANAEYTSHIHDAVCDDDPPGGGHWLADPEAGESASNEIGLSFTTGENGQGNTTATSDLVLDDRAKSIVVHAPEGETPPDDSDSDTDDADETDDADDATSDRVLCGDLTAG